MDVNSCFTAGQAYVMMSRIQCLEQMFIVDNLKESKIMMSSDALSELHRLEEISLNRNPSIWMNGKQGVLRICSMNCAGLRAHFEDLKADEKLQRADILLFQETSLNVNDENNFQMNSHPIQFHVKNGKGKGVSVYMKQIYSDKTWCSEEWFQIAKISLKKLDILNVYRSSASSTDNFCSKVKEMIISSDAPIIFGDFNICGQREKLSKIPRFLSACGLTQLVNEATQIRGRQIDHIYVKNTLKSEVLDIERHSVYYSDHDALLLTLKF